MFWKEGLNGGEIESGQMLEGTTEQSHIGQMLAGGTGLVGAGTDSDVCVRQ